MKVKCLLDVVDVLCPAVLDLLQCVHFLDKVLDRFVFLVVVEFVIEFVDVDDLDSNDLASLSVLTADCQLSFMVGGYRLH